jgi:IS605 OrfB family transposase
MQYTVRAFIEGGQDEKLDEICRIFCSMERTAYNMLRVGMDAGTIKAILRERYEVKNARWIQSSINQARAVMASQEEGIKYRIEQCEEMIRNMREKMKSLSNYLKIEGCRLKIEKYESKAMELKNQLKEKSYPSAVFGSRKLFRQMLIANGQRHDILKREWIERRSNHFFSVGQANQRGNGNTRLLHEGDIGFSLEVRNWTRADFRVPLHVPGHWSELVNEVISRAESVKLGRRGELIDGGLAYSVRVVRSSKGYQVLISFELDEHPVEWRGKLAGIDVNPEGIACTIISKDGNLIATRFFRDDNLIMASKNKRKWILENIVKRMLRWCMNTYGCNAIAVERLRFKSAYDFDSKTNFKLSNFMKRKMLQTIRLHALKMGMLSLEVDPAYSSKVAIVKYGKRYGGFNRHQLAAFVIARRALGYGEAPVLDCLPRTKQERKMWNSCIRYYGYLPQIQTLLHREPMEWKSDGDNNNGGGGKITELLTAPPAITSSQMGLGHSDEEGVDTIEASIESGERAGSIQTAMPAGEMGQEGIELALRTHSSRVRQQPSSLDKEDSVIC